MLRVELLGPFRVRLDVDQPSDDDPIDVTPTGRREQVVLALLTLEHPNVVSTEAIASELYGEVPTSDPRNAVQAIVSRLRKALGPASGTIETVGGGYRLTGATSDLDDAQRLLTDTSTNNGAEPGFAAALSLWRGPALEELGDGTVISNARVRLDELRAGGQEALLAWRLGQETTTSLDASLIGDLEAAVRDYPLRERRWELLMLALYRSGRQADALRAFQRAREMLSQHLGLEPGRALSDLERQILHQDPALESPTSAPSGTAARPLPSGTITVLMCDVVGSVRQWEASPDSMSEQIERMHAIWGATIDDHGGQLVKSTGDGVFAVFTTSMAAINAAVAGQEQQTAANLTVRVALHTGDAEPVDGDYRGSVVNRCARLIDLGHGGQVLTTDATASLATGSLPERVRLRSLGPHWLRDVAEPVVVHQVNAPNLATNFPPLRTEGTSHLPRQRTALLGREDELIAVEAALASGPVVTLMGTGGIGKTSLALAAAWKASETRPVSFVDLASVRSGSEVADRIADALVPGDSDRGAMTRILDRLRANPDLVVVDNAEHLLDEVAAVVDEIASSATQGNILITSRQPLAIAGEQLLTIQPLALPDADGDLAAAGRSPSVRLFLDRMAAIRPDIELSDGMLPVVAHICRRLDGIPLAIELAAGRTGVLRVDDIAARLDDQLRLLRQVPATRQARHRSLEAVVRWSVDQLDPQSRDLFLRLSVMAGSFDARGVEAFAAACGQDETLVLDGLSELVAASLVTQEPGDGGRFRMLEPVRQLASAELEASGRSTETRRGHLRWVSDRAWQAHRTQDERRVRRFAELGRDAHQIRAALRWAARTIGTDEACADGSLELDAAALALGAGWWFLEQDPIGGAKLIIALADTINRSTSPLAWARTITATTLASTTQPVPAIDVRASSADAIAILDDHNDPDRGLARLGAGFAHGHANEFDRATNLAAEAERLISSDETWSMAILDLSIMGFQAQLIHAGSHAADIPTALRRGERAVASFRAMQAAWPLAATLGELGRIYQAIEDYEAAEARFLEALRLLGDLHYHGRHYMLTELGHLASRRGDHDKARSFHLEARRYAEGDGALGCTAQAIAGQASAEADAGDVGRAIDLYREAIALHPRTAVDSALTISWNHELRRLETTPQP